MLDNTFLDEYWLSTQRQTNDNMILKRKADQSSLPKKSAKDRRLSATITNANIIDLSNEGSSGQSATIKWKKAKDSSSALTLVPLHHDQQEHIRTIFNENGPTSPRQKHLKSFPYQYQSPPEAEYIYLIISFM
ncbi:hypothetical protein MBANPS3_005554 [Mucor bainieri]